MKQFIYKMLIFTLSIILIYEFTIGKQISQFSGRLDSISSKEGRKESINKLREELKKAVKKAEAKAMAKAWAKAVAKARAKAVARTIR